MRLPKPIMTAVVLGIILLAAVTASADHYSWSRGHYGGYYGGDVGVIIGLPFWGPSWYYPSSYYYPYYYPDFHSPPAAASSSPPTYIERSDSEKSLRSSAVWFYCPESKSYYPYVRECPGSWQTVPAQPPGMIGR